MREDIIVCSGLPVKLLEQIAANGDLLRAKLYIIGIMMKQFFPEDDFSIHALITKAHDLSKEI